MRAAPAVAAQYAARRQFLRSSRPTSSAWQSTPTIEQSRCTGVRLRGALLRCAQHERLKILLSRCRCFDFAELRSAALNTNGRRFPERWMRIPRTVRNSRSLPDHVRGRLRALARDQQDSVHPERRRVAPESKGASKSSQVFRLRGALLRCAQHERRRFPLVVAGVSTSRSAAPLRSTRTTEDSP